MTTIPAAVRADARREGVSLPENRTSHLMPHRLEFAALWDHLHGPGAWHADPDVVALTFTVERRNVDA